MGIIYQPDFPNFIGMLYNANPKKTAFLQTIGGMGQKFTTNTEFPTNVDFTIAASSQPSISESTAFAGTTPPISVLKTQKKNVTQIFQEFVSITRHKRANLGRISGINTTGTSPMETDERAWQINKALEKMARDVNFTLLNGIFVDTGLTDENVANGTRGIFEAIVTNLVDAGTTALTKTQLDILIKDVFDNGPNSLDDTVLFVNSTKKQAITNIYGQTPLLEVDRDRFRSGINVTKIVTDFGELIVVVDNDVPNTKILLATLRDNEGNQLISPVHAQLDASEIGGSLENAFLIIKDISQTGGQKFEIYQETGLDHGPEYYHGKIINLT